MWLNDRSYSAVTSARVRRSHHPDVHATHDGPATVPGLVVWMNLLAGFRGGGLLRVKGIVNVEGRPYAVQAVQTIVSEPVPLEEWPADHDRRSRLVFITRGISPEAVQRTFSAFAFEGGRDRRNLVIRPETYAHFKQAMEVFREGARRSPKAPVPPRQSTHSTAETVHGAATNLMREKRSNQAMEANRGEGSTRYVVGGRMIDCTGAAPIQDPVIVSEGTRIKQVGSRTSTKIPDGADVLDCGSATLIPG